MLKCRLVKYCLVFVSVLVLAACAGSAKSVAYKKCGTCHTTKVAFAPNYPAEQWKNVINSMKVQGMVTTAEEDRLILEYLAKNHSSK